MKTSIKIFLLICLTFILTGENTLAQNIEGLNLGSSTSISNSSSIGEATKDIGIKLIDIVRFIFSGVLVILIVYFGAKMIMSMGTNEDDLSKAKKGILYALIGIIFINFPIAIYNGIISPSASGDNLFIYEVQFAKIIYEIINFLEYIVIGIAVLVLVYIGLRLMTSRGREEKVTEAKNKILWVLAALIFIGFIEAYKRLILAEGGFNIQFATGIFSQFANLLLYLVAPVALVFVTIAGFYFITSNGNDDRAKKGKSILINTIIGIIILLCSYVLLNDISLLFNI